MEKEMMKIYKNIQRNNSNLSDRLIKKTKQEIRLLCRIHAKVEFVNFLVDANECLLCGAFLVGTVVLLKCC